MARQKKPTYEFLKSKNLYRKRIKDTDGKYVAIYGSTVKELEEKLEYAREAIGNHLQSVGSPTVAEYCEKWLSLHSANVRQTTMIDYKSCVSNNITAHIGNLYMCDVTADDVKYSLLQASKKSNSIYRKTQMLLKQIFKSAEDSGIIQKSPCGNLNPKGGTAPKTKEALTDNQVKILLDSIKGLPCETFVMLGLYAGLRREESLGLKWENVHLGGEAPYISVQTAWHPEHNRPVITSDLKTKAARRNIPIPTILKDFLLIKLKEKGNNKFVISNSSGEPLSQTQWARLWKYVVTRTTKQRTYTRYINGESIKHTVTPSLGEKAKNNNVVYSMDFVPTPHQLRHTYITNLLLSGVDVKTVQYLAGHENSRITLDIYAHLTYNKPEDLKSKIDSAFKIID